MSSVGPQRTSRSHASSFHPYSRADEAAPKLEADSDSTSVCTTVKVARKFAGQSDQKLSVIRQPVDSGMDFGEPIEVIVGPTERAEKFTIHENIAAAESDFIHAALKHEWAENESRTIHLPAHDPGAFSTFFRYCYGGFIYTATKPETDKQHGIGKDPEWYALADAWVIGDYLEASDFKDGVVDAIIHKILENGRSRQSMHKIIYPASSPTAPIRVLLADIAAHEWTASYVKRRHNAPEYSDFWRDVAVARWNVGSQTIPRYRTDRCTYHEHGADRKCYDAPPEGIS